MDTRKDIEESAAAAPSASDTAASSSPPGETSVVDPKIEAAQIAASRTESPPQEPAVETPQAATPRRDEIKLVAFDADAARRAGMSSETPAADSSPRRPRFALLAASVALAGAFGAVAGALGVSGLAQIGQTPTPAAATVARDTPAAQSAIAQTRADLAALKSSVETGNRAINGQFVKLTERFDRLERAESERAAKLTKASESLDRLERRADAAPAKDTTASVPAAQPVAATPAQPPIVDGWVVRDVYRGIAVIQGRRLGMVEVEPGDSVPGIGRIESIKKQDGRWVVVTSKGLITSPR
jgi:hypothetical protein